MANTKKDQFLQRHKAENRDANKASYDLYPKFSFEFNVGNERAVEDMPSEIQIAFLSKLLRLSKLTWKEISALPKSQGLEKIDKKQLKKYSDDPHKFKEEKQVDVFRLPGKKGRLIGYIEGETFYIVWVDIKFNMYKH